MGSEALNRRRVVVEKGDWRQKALLFMQVTTRSSYYKERWELLWAARVLKRTYSDGLNSIDRHDRNNSIPSRTVNHAHSDPSI